MQAIEGNETIGNKRRSHVAIIDPSMKNEQRRMMDILNGVKEKKNVNFVEQMREEQRKIQQLYGP